MTRRRKVEVDVGNEIDIFLIRIDRQGNWLVQRQIRTAGLTVLADVAIAVGIGAGADCIGAAIGKPGELVMVNSVFACIVNLGDGFIGLGVQEQDIVVPPIGGIGV